MPRYALITGASRGIGLALAEALARRGRSLILVARQRDALDSVACELTQRFGVEVLFRVCDLSNPLQLTGLLLELEQGERQIDLLVNNAGIGLSGSFLAHEWADEQQLLELNVLAMTRLCHSLGNSMVALGGGKILNVASLAGFQAGPWMSSYFASKAYVLHLSEGLREEFRDYGVTVSTLCPGPTRSALYRQAGIAEQRMRDSKRMLSAEEVALYAVRALDKNRAIIIPGWRTRLLSLLPRVLPRALLRRRVGRMNKAVIQR
ncbi:SDR family oxidoreductase [Pseudomonas sp. LS44]|uniref:SDR family NAD(P)-dependent oxidoreductase n=1 Tax=Pseudomonas sp. LS44 TaxID=1357074 RepID=UPI00215B63A5|nr:SDR family oxidoreductase [Pseudomonas sp. LS44]UVE17369.1 SDR family oxidoreductase [Pseudomonas sp. LS44]